MKTKNLKNNLRELAFYINTILQDPEYDIQNFSIKYKKSYTIFACTIYNTPNSIEELDDVTGVTLKIRIPKYSYMTTPTILKFGRYKSTVDEYDSKKILMSFYNRKFYSENNSISDTNADKIIDNITKYMQLKKSSQMLEKYPQEVGNAPMPAEAVEAVFNEAMPDNEDMAMDMEEGPMESIGDDVGITNASF